ncbi:ComEC/Rec2 family competence protein [Paralimibaculum aggregatum]|uniref:ComEC/Rec2 family competence protein n=1 Tax=Paralimibaculum aggregatum TaxID=3036245 RepID=A0ABQ6LL12_9RHOB|nr:ComEC/Rec2 family competence protein [Limibaculum sp. NKW23]GMG83667.1 ComEC/Rec2 family competence protein [Limibaculum sp. NKW23]
MQGGETASGRGAAIWAGIRAAEAGRAVLWLPVALGAGIWLYLALPAEPGLHWALAPLVPLAPLLSGHARKGGAALLAALLLVFAAASGFSAALLHARAAAAPVLSGPLHETVDGRVRALSQSGSGAPRLLLDEVVVYGLEPSETPARLRISLIDAALAEAPRPGARVRLYARLFPPGGPVEPGVFDFRRQAWFAGIGGVGYTDAPVLRLPAGGTADRALLWLARLRAEIADGLRARLPGPEGAFAAAILVGDRAGIAETDAEALRAANLAHLLAISGLHMGILCGLVFAGIRLGAAAVPAVALNLSGKKLAAAGALLAGAAYLALSGATVPTQRAYAMAAVALVAVLLDRPALTLRALGLAAILVLLVRPVSLQDPGFQMSFAATAALVAAFERLRALPGRRAPGGLAARIGRRAAVYLGALLLTSIVAGLATAPFAAVHFNRLPVYGLPANLAAVPLMGLWIAPMAILSGLAAPFGLADAPVAAMGAGIGLVLEIAHGVAGWPGAVRLVPAAPEGALGLVALGGLWLVLWRSRLRLAGLGAVALGVALWADPPPRPAVLLAPGARLVGVMGPEGRAIDHPRAQSFAAETWLRRDGDAADQRTASARPGLTHGRGWARADLAEGWRLEVLHGRRPVRAELERLCRPGVLLVARHGPARLTGGCCYFGEARLAATGALAITPGPEGLSVVAAGGVRRPWAPETPAPLPAGCAAPRR